MVAQSGGPPPPPEEPVFCKYSHDMAHLKPGTDDRALLLLLFIFIYLSFICFEMLCYSRGKSGVGIKTIKSGNFSLKSYVVAIY